MLPHGCVLILCSYVMAHSTQRAQNGHTAVVSLLLQAGADVALDSAVGTARDAAHSSGKQAVVDVIDAHLCQQLRHQLADICCALASTTLPVLLLLECFAWTSSTTYASRFVQLPLDEQWRIAKLCSRSSKHTENASTSKLKDDEHQSHCCSIRKLYCRRKCVKQRSRRRRQERSS